MFLIHSLISSAIKLSTAERMYCEKEHAELRACSRVSSTEDMAWAGKLYVSKSCWAKRVADTHLGC